MLLVVSYNAAGDIRSTHPGWTNHISNNPRQPQYERVFQIVSSVTIGKMLLSPDQTNMSLMKDIIRKFTFPGSVVVDSYAGAFSAANPYMLKAQHRRFLGYDLEVNCVTTSLPQLALVFPRQVLNAELDITKDETLPQAAKTFVKAMEARDQIRRVDASKTPAGFPNMQTFLFHILYYLPMYCFLVLSLSVIKQKTSQHICGQHSTLKCTTGYV